MVNFSKKVQEQFAIMMATGMLFRSELTGREVWDMYLASFADGNDDKFRDPESSEHNCNHCKNIIRRYGNIVAIVDNKIVTMFDFDMEGEYAGVAPNIATALRLKPVTEVFFETYAELNSLPYESCNRNNAMFALGIANNVKRYTPAEAALYGVVEAGRVYTFNHFHLKVAKNFVDVSGKSVESIMAGHRDNKQVFMRAMEEIPLDTLQLVSELIAQGSLLNGETHKFKLDVMIPLKAEYDALAAEDRDNWCWVKSRDFQLAKFKNELIGVLCTELAEGEELNKACQSWNKRVDPANYMKAVAPFTQRQKDAAAKFVSDNGYTESFARRLATKDDIKASEIKHINAGDGTIEEVSMFDNLKTTKPSRHKRNQFDGVEEVGIEKFMKDILPTCTSVEAYLENTHANNMVTMTTAGTDASKPMFGWPNNYSWTYNGNLAGKSEIRENVSKVGGNIVALVRASLQWNDKDTPGSVDFDLHSVGANHISYSNKGRTHSCGGHLDVDMIRPSKIGIENITWKNQIADGKYQIRVKNYCGSNNTGFKVEIEFNGETYNYVKLGNVRGYTEVATITVVKGEISIEHHLPETHSSRDIYGLESKQFHKVNLMCLSPNHWGGSSVGNKHYFFMLDKCKAQSPVRSYHIENFNSELAEHRKVLEPLASTIMLSPEGEQLSGLGFNATVRDELIVKLGGNFKRVIKIKF